ncbi:MAG: NAD(P)-dependent oxidoreductase [Nannocystaceae bacterium]
MRTLITGANGFLGHHAAHRSCESGRVLALVRRGSSRGGLESSRLESRLEVVEWDGRTASLSAIVKRFAPDRVFHLAASYRRSHVPEDVVELVDANVRLTAQVLEAAGTAAVVLATSHFMHYGGPRRALNLYAATKLAMLEVARYYGDAQERRWGALTLYDVYGPGDTRLKLVDTAITAAREGRLLRTPADDPVLRLLHVDDAVTALHAVAAAVIEDDAWVGQEFAAVPPDGVRMHELLQTVEQVVGRPVRVDPRPYPSPARTITDPYVDLPTPPSWSPRIDLLRGLATVVDHGAS